MSAALRRPLYIVECKWNAELCIGGSKCLLGFTPTLSRVMSVSVEIGVCGGERSGSGEGRSVWVGQTCRLQRTLLTQGVEELAAVLETLFEWVQGWWARMGHLELDSWGLRLYRSTLSM